jgi:hypothetical protein
VGLPKADTVTCASPTPLTRLSYSRRKTIQHVPLESVVHDIDAPTAGIGAGLAQDPPANIGVTDVVAHVNMSTPLPAGSVAVHVTEALG